LRIAFVHVPRLPCAVETQREPSLARAPLIIGDADQPKQVLDCSTQAEARGVRPGIAIRKALGLCPEAAVLAPDPVLYHARWQAALDALDDVSPEVEDAGLGRAYLNAAGLQAHYRDEAALGARILEAVEAASGLAACAGLAEGKFPAQAAALSAVAGSVRAVPAGSEAAFLAPFSVAALPLDPEVVSRLQLLGFETLGEVACLTLPELQSQFGAAGRRLWQLVNGSDEERLRPRRRSEVLEASLGFEAPVAGIDVMIAAARQLLSRLRLPLKGRAARELTLQAELVSGRGWEKRLVFREAVSEDARLLFLLRSTLDNFPPPTAIRGLTLRLSGLTGETGKQLSLDDRARLQRQVEEAVRQLKARYGFSPLYRCLDVEPWSVVPEERQVLVETDA
jgi:nucleotidyltransferase/DNA polymerase involved in DNA repair